MNKNKVKNSKAITLIALVITIVVLIILAGVAINLTLSQNGIFNKAKDARELYINAQEDEQEKINEITEQITTGEFSNGKNDSSSGNNGNTTPDKELAEITKDLKVGDYIKYNTGVTSVGENGIVTCRVLYDASSEYRLQIISDKSIKNLTFGGSDWETAKTSYNNAIQTLNTEAEKYLNTTYATDARCVGSVPTLQNGIFTNKNSETNTIANLQFTPTGWSTKNSGYKDYDTNYEIDRDQIYIMDKGETETNYWFASRNTASAETFCFFNLRCGFAKGGSGAEKISQINSNGTIKANEKTSGLRPCFALKTDISITGGEGTSERPYTL